MTLGGWEQFDVEAAVGVRGWGPSRAAAVAQLTRGVFSLSAAPATVEVRERREVRAQAAGPEALLVTWINECLYVHDVEGFVARRIEIEVFDDTARSGGERLRLHSFLHGEEVDPSRHRLGTVVKAATMREVSTRASEGGFETRLVLDV